MSALQCLDGFFCGEIHSILPCSLRMYDDRDLHEQYFLSAGRRSAWTWRCLKDGEPEGPFQCPASIQYDHALHAARFTPQAAPTPLPTTPPATLPATPPAPESAAPFAAAEKYTAQFAAGQQASYLVETGPISPHSAVLAHVGPVNLSQQQLPQMPPTPSQPSPLEGYSAEAPGGPGPGASTPLPPLLSFLETADPTSADWQLSAQQTVAAAHAPSPGAKASNAVPSDHANLPCLTSPPLDSCAANAACRKHTVLPQPSTFLSHTLRLA